MSARGFLGFPGEPNFPFVVEVEDVQQAEVPRHSKVKSTPAMKPVVQRAKTITPVCSMVAGLVRNEVGSLLQTRESKTAPGDGLEKAPVSRQAPM